LSSLRPELESARCRYLSAEAARVATCVATRLGGCAAEAGSLGLSQPRPPGPSPCRNLAHVRQRSWSAYSSNRRPVRRFRRPLVVKSWRCDALGRVLRKRRSAHRWHDTRGCAREGGACILPTSQWANSPMTARVVGRYDLGCDGSGRAAPAPDD
jgi:hypothetical protein